MTAQLVADVREEPGALPLMQFVLSDLVDGSADGAISIGAYDEGGGVLGAIGRRAGEVYAALDPEDQTVAEHIFLRLVTVSDDADDVRRRVRRSELESLEVSRGSVDRVLDAFGTARLLTFDRDPITRGPTVEVAHEALLREWDQFRDWVTERRASLLTRARFEAAMDEWSASGEAEDHLPTGGRLVQFEEWAADPLVSLAAEERSFLDVALERRDRDAAERRRRRRAIMGGFAAAAVIASVLAVAAWVQRGEAERSALRDQATSMIAEAQGIPDPDLRVHLALESVDLYEQSGSTPRAAVAAVRDGVTSHRIRARLPGGGFVAVRSDGELLATRSVVGGIELLDASQLHSVATIPPPPGADDPIYDAAFVGASNELVTLVGGFAAMRGSGSPAPRKAGNP